jgi:hypothetical protein
MISALSLGWLGIGLLVLTSPQRAPQLLSREPGRPIVWLARTLGAGLLVPSAWPLAAASGTALRLVAMLVATMAMTSLAVLLVPLRPRLYAASVVGAALTAGISWLCRV